MDKRQRRMVGHGAVVTLLGLLAGFGLLINLIGGFEVLPGTIVEFSIPSDNAAWARTHAGGIMNGMLVMTGVSSRESPSGDLTWKDDAVCVAPWLQFDGYALASRQTACRLPPAYGQCSY